MTIKKLSIYSLAFVAFFGLSSNACENAEDLLDIDVPTTIKKSFVITTNEAEEKSFTQTVNPADEDIEEYRERVKSISADRLLVSVTDNGSDGNTGSGELTIIAGGSSFSVGQVEDINQLDGLEIQLTGDLKDAITSSLENFQEFDVEFLVSSDGAINYNVDVTIEGLLTASPL